MITEISKEKECKHIYGTDKRFHVTIDYPKEVFQGVDNWDMEGMEFDNYCRKCGKKLK